MSAETLRHVEEAIRAHFQDTFDADTADERRTAVIIDWVVGYTVSNIVDVDGANVVGYHNDYISADSNPNAQAHLAQWVSSQIAYVLDPTEDDDD